MALIKCSECGRDISDKASSCPNCGMPITEALKIVKRSKLGVESENTEFESSDEILCPDFPSDMRIGDQIVNWSQDAAFTGKFDRRINLIESLKDGKVSCSLHSHGISFMTGLSMFKIHNSQIINIVKSTNSELTNTKKSVIGRAIVGGLIFGPLGAIIGGVSGIGSKEDFKTNKYVIFNFWDVKTRTAQSLIIIYENDIVVDNFLNRHKSEQELNVSQNRNAGDNKTPVWMIIVFIIIIASFLSYFIL